MRMTIEVPGDAIDTEVADHARPEGVIEIGDKSLARLRWPQQTRQQLGNDGRMRRREWEAHGKLGADVEPLR